MFSNGEWKPPEPKADTAAKVEVIDRQIGELALQWEHVRDNRDLSRRLARLWGERFELNGDEESFKGALYFSQHINGILLGGDPSIVRKLGQLKLKQLDLHIKPLEAWVAEWGGSNHEDTVEACEVLADMMKSKAELLANQEMEQALFTGNVAESRVKFW